MPELNLTKPLSDTNRIFLLWDRKIIKNIMKLQSVSALLALLGQAGAFTTSSRPSFSSSLRVANVLEGKEIGGDFTPINNMLLVKKAEIVDQTEGGIFLTGKVR